MANPSPGPNDGSAAWHTLMRDRSLQFDFPDAASAQPRPGWLVALGKFLDAHAAWFRYGGWILLAVIVAAALYYLARFAMRRGWTRPQSAAARTLPSAWQPSPERARLLLADADALAAQGRFDDAAHLLLLVAVQEIGERRPGLLRPALTAREIAGLDALSPRARTVFGAIAQVVERCLFGGRALGQADFASIRAAFEQFTIPETWRAALLVGICALAMLALMILYAFAPELRAGSSDEANALSRSAVGFAGLGQLLNASGIAARLDRGDQPDAKPGLTILTPAEDTDPNDLAAYRTQGPVLVILPKWQTVPMRDHPGWVEKVDTVPAPMLQKQTASVTGAVSLARDSATIRDMEIQKTVAAIPGMGMPPQLRIEKIQTLVGPMAMLLVPGRGALLVRSPLWKDRDGYVMSDPDVMNNRGLSNPSNARAAIAIIAALRQGNGPVAMDVTLNGLGKAPSLLRAAFGPPFLGATICALVAALLMGLHTAIRFGAPLVPPRIFARGKKALADNSAELVRMMGREGAMAPRYVAAARSLVLERLGARRAAPQQQQALLDALGGGETYDQLAAEAAIARSGGDLLLVARKTFDWRRRISGGY